jgi:CheY-like chemotaxis protein
MRALVEPAQEDIRITGKVRTLIADDSPLMLRILAQVLASEGNFTLVGTVTDGRQAVRQTLNMKPDLVLMDYSMPHINGMEATRYIKQFENPPAIIIITSDDSPNSRSMAKNAGADAFVVKAGDIRVQLRARLQELFGSHHEGGKSSTGICSASCLAPGCSI